MSFLFLLTLLTASEVRSGVGNFSFFLSGSAAYSPIYFNNFLHQIISRTLNPRLLNCFPGNNVIVYIYFTVHISMTQLLLHRKCCVFDVFSAPVHKRRWGIKKFQNQLWILKMFLGFSLVSNIRSNIVCLFFRISKNNCFI